MTLKSLNIFRTQRFYNRGLTELGRTISLNGGLFGNKIDTDPEVKRQIEQCVKRANWIYNLVNHGVAFRGECI